jgi:hypothetical protein
MAEAISLALTRDRPAGQLELGVCRPRVARRAHQDLRAPRQSSVTAPLPMIHTSCLGSRGTRSLGDLPPFPLPHGTMFPLLKDRYATDHDCQPVQMPT